MKWRTLLELILILAISITFSSCSVATYKNKSVFIGSSVKIGMSKEEFIDKHGTPFKVSAHYDDKRVLHETLYYKENVYTGAWYIINTIFYFEDSVLVSQEQGEEERQYSSSCNCKH